MASARRQRRALYGSAGGPLHHDHGRDRQVEVRGSARAGSTRRYGLHSGGLITLVLLSGLLVPVRMQAGQDPPTTIELRIIVVSSQAEAEQLLQRLQTGEDFAALARQKSIDPSASDGGSLGRVDPETLRTELRDALRGALSGQIKGPVKIPTGYAILKVEGPSVTAGAAPITAPASNQGTPPVVSSGQGM